MIDDTEIENTKTGKKLLQPKHKSPIQGSQQTVNQAMPRGVPPIILKKVSIWPENIKDLRQRTI